MATEQWIDWWGECASTLLLFGFLYVIIRMVDGPGRHPVISLPLVWRVALFLVLAAIATTVRVWVANRRKRRRQQVR